MAVMNDPVSTFLEDEHMHVWEEFDVMVTLERFREERGELRADCQPQSASGSGTLPAEKVNLSSARSIKMYANTLGGYGLLDAETWFAVLSKACDISKHRYREGAPSIRLHEVDWRGRPRFLLEPFIEAHNRAILFGDGGVSKSLHALAMAVSVATGAQIIPHTELYDSGPVLYLDWEDDPETHAERLHAICSGARIAVPDNIHYMRRTGSLHESTREIRRLIATEGVVLVVVDSVGAACGGDPERAADVIRTFDAMRALEKPVIAIHHIAKNAVDKSQPFGSVYARNLCRIMWRLDRESGVGGEIYVRASHQKGNNVEVFESLGHRVKFDSDENRQLTSVTFTQAHEAFLPPASKTHDGLRDAIGAALRDGAKTVHEVAVEVGCTDATARTQLNRHKDWFVKVDETRWGILSRAVMEQSVMSDSSS